MQDGQWLATTAVVVEETVVATAVIIATAVVVVTTATTLREQKDDYKNQYPVITATHVVTSFRIGAKTLFAALH